MHRLATIILVLYIYMSVRRKAGGHIALLRAILGSQHDAKNQLKYRLFWQGCCVEFNVALHLAWLLVARPISGSHASRLNHGSGEFVLITGSRYCGAISRVCLLCYFKTRASSQFAFFLSAVNNIVSDAT